MKKKALLFVTLIAVLACVFALGVCAADPSTSDEFGEITIVDELSGRTDYGYSQGDCARIVLQIPETDTYVTYPMYYCFGVRNDGQWGMQPMPDFTALNTATGYAFSTKSVIRLEMPEYFTAISTNYTKSNEMTNLRYLKLNKNFVYIHQNALEKLTKLEEVVFVDDPTSDVSFNLGRSAFYGCTALTRITLPSQVASVGERCFEGCTSLTTFDFNSKVTSTGTAAFLDCKALTTVNVPENNSIVTISHKSFYNCTSLAGGFVFQNATTIESCAFQNCYALTGEYVFSSVTFIDSYAFNNAATNADTHLTLRFPAIVNVGTSGDNHIFSNSGVEKIYFGPNIAKMTLNNYNSCKRLEVIEMTGVAEGFAFNSYTFRDCTALKSFCIPEGVTSLPSRMFESCSSLTAVYLPSTLTAIYSGGNNFATFFRCTSMYFVNEPFTSDNIPAEPDIYYFPSGLVHIEGEAFDTSRLNDVVVFPEGFTVLENQFTFEGVTSKSGKPNVVFLGNMRSVSSSYWNINKIYFCNPADVDNASAGSSNNANNVFCYGKDNTEHLTERAVEMPAGCETDAGVYTYCFCGAEISKDTIPGTAWAHDYDYINNPLATLVSITYTSFGADGVKTVTCAKCGVDGDLVAYAFLACQGYSVKEIGEGGMAIGYRVNKAAIKEYSDYTGKEITFGVFAGVDSNIGENDVVDASGKLINKVLGQQLNSYAHSVAVIKVVGFETEAQMSAKLAMGAYVIVGDGESAEISYVQAYEPQDGAKYYFASFNDIVQMLN